MNTNNLEEISINVRLSNEEHLSLGSPCKPNVPKAREGKGLLVSWAAHFELNSREEIFDTD